MDPPVRFPGYEKMGTNLMESHNELNEPGDLVGNRETDNGLVDNVEEIRLDNLNLRYQRLVDKYLGIHLICDGLESSF